MIDNLKKYWFVVVICLVLVAGIGFYAKQQIGTVLRGKTVEGKQVVSEIAGVNYFAEDYNLTMVALEEEGKEADPRRFREVIDMAKEKGIKVIFYQEDIDGRQSRTFAEELGGQAEKVSPMATDYVENLLRMARTFAMVLK